MLVTSQRMVHEFAWLVLSPQLKKPAAQIQHEIHRLEENAPQASFHPTAKENEMKLQILDKGLDSNIEGGKSVLFFNELDTGIRTMLKNPGSIPRPLFHFLTRLTQKQNYARKLCFMF
jgi:hypothetical protein